MPDIKERIKELRGVLKLSQGDFGKPLGFSFATISGYERSGIVPLSGVKSICNYYRVREAWLVSGEGEMFEPEETTDDIERIAERYALPDVAVSILRGYLSLTAEDRNTLAELVHKMAASQRDGAQSEKKKNGPPRTNLTDIRRLG